MRRAMASSDACCGGAVAPAGAGWVCALAGRNAEPTAKQDATRNARRETIICPPPWIRSRERVSIEAHHQRLHPFGKSGMHKFGVDDGPGPDARLQQRDEDVDQLSRLGAADEYAEDAFAIRVEEDLATSPRLVHFPRAGD